MTDLISMNAEILGGTPCFRGSRVPIVVLFYHLAGGKALAEIFDAYPAIPREAVLAALSARQFPIWTMQGHVDNEELALWQSLADEVCCD